MHCLARLFSRPKRFLPATATMAPSQFFAAVNKILRLKASHWINTVLEILLPVGFLAFLLLFKDLADRKLCVRRVAAEDRTCL